jgi:catechol 2,3-dioxygenase-like lactoylglutathione lyase family enzyme
MTDWYARPVFFVESVERTVAFYMEKLGFTEGPSFAEDGRLLVGQVDRRGCSILLTCQWSEKNGRGRMFISLDLEEWTGLKAEFEERGATVKDGWWGSEMMIIEDPDGNELFFPHPGGASEG